jgi:hypothetical protein
MLAPLNKLQFSFFWSCFKPASTCYVQQSVIHYVLQCTVMPKSKSKLCYDRQSVGQSVLVSGTHLGPATIFSLLFSVLTIAGILMWGVLSDEDGSVM